MPAHHAFTITITSNNDISVGNSPAAKKPVNDTFSLGPVLPTTHAWYKTGTDRTCKCEELTGHCPLLLNKTLTIKEGANLKDYRIGTVDPGATTGGVIAGDAGTLRVGSVLGEDDDDPHRPR